LGIASKFEDIDYNLEVINNTIPLKRSKVAEGLFKAAKDGLINPNLPLSVIIEAESEEQPEPGADGGAIRRHMISLFRDALFELPEMREFSDGCHVRKIYGRKYCLQ